MAQENPMNKPVSVSAATLVALTLCMPAVAGEVSPQSIDGAVTLDTAEAKAMFDREVAFVDVRKDSDWDAGRIPGAIHLDIKSKFSEESLAGEIEKGESVVIYCNGASCMRSSDASAMAVGWGFTRVHYYRDGFPAWKAAGNPVE
jgi:rhodanese-related sulfurtransferase